MAEEQRPARAPRLSLAAFTSVQESVHESLERLDFLASVDDRSSIFGASAEPAPAPALGPGSGAASDRAHNFDLAAPTSTVTSTVQSGVNNAMSKLQ